MHKIWIMGLKQHNIIKWKCYKIYVSHTCKKQKGQLKMMEDEQNLKENNDKGTLEKKVYEKIQDLLVHSWGYSNNQQ